MPLFRRRPLPPRWRGARRLPPAGQPALLRLQQAHRLMAEGQYAQAALLFGELGDEAAARSIPRAPQLNLQSGRAWVLAGDPAKGQPRLRQGLRLMAQMGQVGRLPVVARRLLDELRARGLTAEAETLEADLRASLPGLDLHGPTAVPAAEPSRRCLPPKCPYCGGSVHPDSVDWIDEACAACGYCGSVLETEG